MKTYDYVSEKIKKSILFSAIAAVVSFLVLIVAIVILVNSMGVETAVQEIKNQVEIDQGADKDINPETDSKKAKEGASAPPSHDERRNSEGGFLLNRGNDGVATEDEEEKVQNDTKKEEKVQNDAKKEEKAQNDTNDLENVPAQETVKEEGYIES